MNGLVLVEPGRLEIASVEAKRPGPDEVLIEVDNIGLCGSDLHLSKGTYNGPHRYPMYFGHEWAGRVVEVGAGAAAGAAAGAGGELAVGDLVTGDCSIFCSECEMCGHDRNLCSHIEKFGITVDGASRRLITMNKRHVYKAPPGVRVDLLSLAEPLAVAARAVGRAAALIGSDSMPGCMPLVLGAGPIGLGAILALRRLHGVATVYGDDLVDSRRLAIFKVGGKPVAQSEAAGGDYSSLYSNTLWDLVVETTGAPTAVARALAEVKPGGVVVLLGFLPKAEYDLKLVTVKALTVVGSIGGTGDFDDALRLIAEHPVEVETLVGRQFNYTEAVKAFELGLERSVAGKVQISFRD